MVPYTASPANNVDGIKMGTCAVGLMFKVISKVPDYSNAVPR